MKIAEAAREHMLETGMEMIYTGTFGDLHAVANRANKLQGAHPLNLIACVMSCIGKSDLFRKSGYIEHLGRHYPVYELKVKK